MPNPQDQESVSNNYQGEETLHNMTGVIQKPSTYNAFEGNDGDVLFFDDRECLEMIRKVELRRTCPLNWKLMAPIKPIYVGWRRCMLTEDTTLTWILK